VAEAKVIVKGVDKTLARLARMNPRARQALKAALYMEGENIMGESKRQVPVDTGNLRTTGHVEPPKEASGIITVTLGYGGPAAPYAVYIHEDLTKRHAVGKAKYLEDPANEAAKGLTERVGRRVREAVEEER